MIKNKIWAVPFLMICFFSCGKNNGSAQNPGPGGGATPDSAIGKVLSDWKEGYMDIHAINTGRGESTLYILPDGTTMLIDAASSLLSESDPIPPTSPKPNGSITAGQVITNYINYFIKATGNSKLNYMMLSHFHPDHMGSYVSTLPLASAGTFRMTGITEIGAKIPFDKIIDRGYPDYNFPTNTASTALMSNYIKFINWAKTAYNATAEQIDVGKADQIVLKKNPSKYTNFQVRNIAGNGRVWLGTGNGSINTLPEASVLVAADADENILSIGLEMSYGKFNYFCGGDLQYNGKSTYAWKDIETPIAIVMNQVDAMKANHHGTGNCNGAVFLNKLAAQTVLIHPWRDVQPNPETIGRFYDANIGCNIFSTNMTNPNKVRLSEYISKIKSMQGHIVLRVHPGGDKYTVYILDDSNEQYKVTDVYGPYQSK